MVTPAERKEGKKATAAATWCVVMGRGRLMKYVEMLLPTTPCGGGVVLFIVRKTFEAGSQDPGAGKLGMEIGNGG